MAGAEDRPNAQSSGGSLPRAFEPWYRDEFPRLVRALSLIGGDRELAVDAASEACARALERWEQVGVMASPTGWTYTVGLNILRRTLRRRNLEQLLVHRHTEADPVLSPETQMDLWDALSRLPRRERTAVVLHYFVDLPQHEVANIMSVAPGTVAATLHAARKKLRLGFEVDTGDDDA
jgi:RNA polymerase sigma-70 factor, ECF subfamily